VSMHAHTHTHSHTHTHMHAHTHTHTHAHTHHAHVRAHTCIHTYAHARTHTLTHSLTRTRTPRTCVCVCARAHAHTHTHTLFTQNTPLAQLCGRRPSSTVRHSRGTATKGTSLRFVGTDRSASTRPPTRPSSAQCLAAARRAWLHPLLESPFEDNSDVVVNSVYNRLFDDVYDHVYDHACGPVNLLPFVCTTCSICYVCCALLPPKSLSSFSGCSLTPSRQRLHTTPGRALFETSHSHSLAFTNTFLLTAGDINRESLPGDVHLIRPPVLFCLCTFIPGTEELTVSSST
jgi:hypothetical protein